jgi:hypothetical protein
MRDYLTPIINNLINYVENNNDINGIIFKIVNALVFIGYFCTFIFIPTYISKYENFNENDYMIINIVLFISIIITSICEVILITSVSTIVNDLYSFNNFTTKYILLSFLTSSLFFFPWSQLNKTNKNYIKCSDLEAFQICFSLVCVSTYHLRLGVLTAYKLYGFMNSLVINSRSKLININGVKQIYNFGESDKIKETILNKYDNLEIVVEHLSIMMSITVVEFTTSTILIFYILLNNKPFDIITVELSLLSVIPFSISLLNIVPYNEIIKTLENNLNCDLDMSIKLFSFIIDSKFVVSLLSPIVSYVYKVLK